MVWVELHVGRLRVTNFCREDGCTMARTGPPHRAGMLEIGRDVRRFAFAIAVLLCGIACPAMAAPTCQDVNGSAARCGAPNAMPLGWRLSEDEYHRRQQALGNTNDPWLVVNAVTLIAGLFAIIALLPNFDGRSDRDWDRQEGDTPPRRRRR